MEIKVRPTAEQKRLFEKAAAEAVPVAQSLNQWLLAAGMEKIERLARDAKRKAAREGKKTT